MVQHEKMIATMPKNEFSSENTYHRRELIHTQKEMTFYQLFVSENEAMNFIFHIYI